MVEARGQEHQPSRVRVLRSAEELRKGFAAELLIEERYVRRDGRGTQHSEDGVGECWWHAAFLDQVPLDLLVERPRVCDKRLLPKPTQLEPIPFAHCDPSKREQAALVNLPTLVKEEEPHL
jgi:hypothetical protein